ncbi:MAG: stalk domain-containing protein [Candidatus Ornithomonoglobus sp.]
MKKLVFTVLLLILGAVPAYAAQTINSADDFHAIYDNPAGDYELESDIYLDFTAEDKTDKPNNEWFDFSGILNGNGHTITVVKANRTISKMSLFKNLKGAHIYNLNLNCTLTPTGYDVLGNGAYLAQCADENTVIEYIDCTGYFDATNYVTPPFQLEPSRVPEFYGLVASNCGVIRSCTAKLWRCNKYGTYTYDNDFAGVNSGEITNCRSGLAMTDFERNDVWYTQKLPKDREYIVYREPWRGNRIEAVCFEVTKGAYTNVEWTPAQNTDGTWSGGLKLADDSRFANPVKYYYDNGEWVEFERGYDVISNNASEVLTSTLDVVDNGRSITGMKRIDAKCVLPSTTADSFIQLDAVTVQTLETVPSGRYTSAGYYTNDRFVQYSLYKLGDEWIGGMELTKAEDEYYYGYKNSEGEQLIPNEYRYIAPFENDLAVALNKDRKWGALDKNGNITVPFEYDKAQDVGIEYDFIGVATGGITSTPPDWHRYSYRISADDNAKLMDDTFYRINPVNGRAVIKDKYIIDKRYVEVYAGGKYLSTDTPACIVGDCTMLPIRALCEALDCEVSYDAATATATISKGDKYIALSIGWQTAETAEGEMQLSAAPVISDDRIMAAMRDIAEYFGFNVEWDSNMYRALIS